jgi:transposase
MNDELRSEVLRRRYGGQSGRDIASELHLSRKTVAKVLIEHRQQRANGASLASTPRKARASLVDAHEATLRDYLAGIPT